jgi:hypothetical protein
MLLVAEIVLTVLVWQKGWKWLSLIPVISALLIGLMFGIVGGSLIVSPWIILIDVLTVIGLIVMLYNKPKQNNELTK